MNTNGVKERLHWVALAGPAWGHTRSLLHLCSNFLLRAEHLTITVFIHYSEVEKCEKERERCLTNQNNQGAVQRFIIVPLKGDANYKLDPKWAAMNMPVANLFDECKYAFGKCWKELCNAGSDMMMPSKLIVDLFLAPPYELVRETAPSIEIHVWFSSNFVSFWLHYTPHSLHGDGDYYERSKQAWAKMSDKEKEPYGNDVAMYYVTTHANRGNDVVEVPGLPKYYEYEHNPSHFPTPPPLILLWETATDQIMKQSDGVLVASDELLESVASKKTIDWYEKTTGKKMYATGFPLLIESKGGQAGLQTDPSPVEEEIVKFLDTHKEKSVLYISFGTVFFPINYPGAINTMVEVLLNTKRPFVLSRASMMFGPQDDHFESRLENARKEGLCFISEWIPQTTVLSHPSTSAFLTHCGWNSTCEAVAANVPLICWPLKADQPSIALKFSTELDVAWELLEARGAAVKKEPPYRRIDAPLQGTMTALQAEFERVFQETEVGNAVGDRKREKMGKISDLLKHNLAKGGETSKLLDLYIAS